MLKSIFFNFYQIFANFANFLFLNIFKKILFNRYSFCIPTIFAANVSLYLMNIFNFYFFLPLGMALMLSFWKDYYMIKDSALPRFFINLKFKLILISNMVFLLVVICLLQSVKYNREMRKVKQEYEDRISQNLSNFMKEDEEEETRQERILKQLKDPKS